MGLLEYKCLVVIGGTSGIGLSAAQAFLREGAHLVAIGKEDEYFVLAEKQLTGPVRLLGGDATLPDTAVHAIRHCREQFGDFHGLYHVAGGSGRKFGDGPLHQVSNEGIEATLEMNLKSVIYSNRAAIQDWREREQPGSILNAGSVLAFSPAPFFFGTHVYAAAKAAIIGLSQSLAAYYAPHQIRVNVLAPGLVDTPMARRAAQDPQILRYVNTKQPLEGGRISIPADLDAAAVYFMSDGSRFCTGQVLAVDGGWSLSDGQLPGGIS